MNTTMTDLVEEKMFFINNDNRVFISESLDTLCIITKEDKNRALIDTTCPTMVAGTTRVKQFLGYLS